MSFYGSVQYQVFNAFSKMVFSNSGQNSSLVISPSENLKDTISIDAIGRKSAIQLSSGNRWLQFKEGENNTCFLWHAVPDTKDNTQLFILSAESSVPGGSEITELSLSNDIYLSVPNVYYDETGHLICDAHRKYFHIPKIELQVEVDTISEKVDTLEENIHAFEESINSTVTNLTQILDANVTQITTNKTNISTMDAQLGDYTLFSPEQSIPLFNALGDVEELRKSLETSKAICSLLKEVYLEAKELSTLSISIVNRLNKIEEKLGI